MSVQVQQQSIYVWTCDQTGMVAQTVTPDPPSGWCRVSLVTSTGRNEFDLSPTPAAPYLAAEAATVAAIQVRVV